VIVVVDVRPAKGFGVKAGAVALCRAARRLAAARGAEFSGRVEGAGMKVGVEMRGPRDEIWRCGNDRQRWCVETRRR
jgi:hypothetical protein